MERSELDTHGAVNNAKYSASRNAGNLDDSLQIASLRDVGRGLTPEGLRNSD